MQIKTKGDFTYTKKKEEKNALSRAFKVLAGFGKMILKYLSTDLSNPRITKFTAAFDKESTASRKGQCLSIIIKLILEFSVFLLQMGQLRWLQDCVLMLDS